MSKWENHLCMTVCATFPCCTDNHVILFLIFFFFFLILWFCWGLFVEIRFHKADPNRSWWEDETAQPDFDFHRMENRLCRPTHLYWYFGIRQPLETRGWASTAVWWSVRATKICLFDLLWQALTGTGINCSPFFMKQWQWTFQSKRLYTNTYTQ